MLRDFKNAARSRHPNADYYDKLIMENIKLKKAINFSREFFHLPQEVLDVFRFLVPENDQDISRDYFEKVIKG